MNTLLPTLKRDRSLDRKQMMEREFSRVFETRLPEIREVFGNSRGFNENQVLEQIFTDDNNTSGMIKDTRNLTIEQRLAHDVSACSSYLNTSSNAATQMQSNKAKFENLKKIQKVREGSSRVAKNHHFAKKKGSLQSSLSYDVPINKHNKSFDIGQVNTHSVVNELVRKHQ